jgi:hypothetical protein
MQIKKSREREVFDAVYRSRMPARVVPSERPDFVASLSTESSEFGVEVAEFFDSTVAARLQRLPGYVGDLLGGSDVRHKEDRRQLTIDKISITDANGIVKHPDVPAVIRQVPNLETCARKVAELMRAKDAKLASALGNLRHINLIIADRTGLLRSLDQSSFYGLFCGLELRQAVRGCRFREVYFVTSFKSGEAYVPLKLLVTLAGLFLFHPVVAQYYTDGVATVAQRMRLFASYLDATTAGPVGTRFEGGLIEVLYGDSGFIVDDQLATTIRTYNDWPWPADAFKEAVRGEELPVGLLGAVNVFESKNTFSTEIAFPVGPIGSKS